MTNSHHNSPSHTSPIVCPRCDGNGFLYMTMLQPINQTIIMCDECEAVWPINTECFTSTNFEDFTLYVERLGYAYDSIELTNVNYHWLPIR